MSETGLMQKFRESDSVRLDEDSLAILLYLYDRGRAKCSQIMEDLNLPKEKIYRLYEEHFIQENPHPEDEDKTFILSYGGNILVGEILNKDKTIFEELNKKAEGGV